MGLFDFLRKLFGVSSPPPSAPWPPLGPVRPNPPQPTQAPAPQTSWPASAPIQPPVQRAAISPPPPASPPPPQRPARREINLALDASSFQPLSTEDVKAQAAGVQFSGFFEFGRRDRIPSPLDPRTKLIDQAMIGQGLIMTDDVLRIHEIGRQMDELRPQQAGVHNLAAQAVQADKEARARIKAEKKAAAERRKREHAERVAHNKSTDIVYLGRGVSAGLSNRRGNVEKLQSLGLPMLSTPADVAAAMGLAIPRLRWLAFHAEASTRCHYIHFPVAKKSGGERILSAPHKQMSEAQRWILENILRKLPAHSAAHGFVTGRSILTNAQLHVGSAVVVNCDLTDFFPSITVHRVIGLFKQAGYSPAVATVLALLVTECPRRKVTFNGQTWFVAAGPRGLPQGACTSPAISNVISRRMDARFSGLCRKLGWTYTRYADDLTFSSKAASDRVGYLLARVRHITQDEGFTANEKKTRILKPSARQSVTGVVTNQQPGAPRALRKKMRAILHNAKKTGLAAQNRQRHPHFTAWVGGTVEYISMLNPGHGKQLKEDLGKIS